MSTAEILKNLESRGFKLAIAESLTGGLLSAEFVSVAGASKVLLGAIVAYQTGLKHELLGVSRTLLEKICLLASAFSAISASFGYLFLIKSILRREVKTRNGFLFNSLSSIGLKAVE